MCYVHRCYVYICCGRWVVSRGEWGNGDTISILLNSLAIWSYFMVILTVVIAKGIGFQIAPSFSISDHWWQIQSLRKNVVKNGGAKKRGVMPATKCNSTKVEISSLVFILKQFFRWKFKWELRNDNCIQLLTVHCTATQHCTRCNTTARRQQSSKLTQP